MMFISNTRTLPVSWKHCKKKCKNEKEGEVFIKGVQCLVGSCKASFRAPQKHSLRRFEAVRTCETL